MKIGEFAKICNTRISVLRHYDKEKLLEPEHTDMFSGYRYYSSNQIEIFHKITALKKAGFALHEIRRIISLDVDKAELTEMFKKREAELRLELESLKEAQQIMSQLNILFDENKAIVSLSKSDDAESVCRQMELQLKSADYQRISQYKTNEDKIYCDVIRLNDEIKAEASEIPFENDEQAVGKWEVLGTYAVKDDVYENKFCEKGFYGDDVKFIYFLPQGEEYWGYSWTKGYFINNGYLTGCIYNEYEISEKTDGTYMLITMREDEICRGGRPTYLLLKKADSNKYSAESIARKDNIDKPFVNDERIIGKWRAHSFLCNKSEFPQEEENMEDLYFKQIEFFPNGSCRCIYEDAVFEGEDTVMWTKNYLLRKWNWSACEYEIRELDGALYMIIEWKSGDYRYGGFDTNYYVFVKES